MDDDKNEASQKPIKNTEIKPTKPQSQKKDDDKDKKPLPSADNFPEDLYPLW